MEVIGEAIKKVPHDIWVKNTDVEWSRNRLFPLDLPARLYYLTEAVFNSHSMDLWK